MKNVFFLFAFIVFGLVSCDDCETPPASQNIIGEWTSDGGDVEFLTDGTLIDPDDAIIGIGDPEAEKTYSFPNSDVLSVTATVQGSSTSSEFGFENISCDEIGLQFFGVTVGFERLEN